MVTGYRDTDERVEEEPTPTKKKPKVVLTPRQEAIRGVLPPTVAVFAAINTAYVLGDGLPKLQQLLVGNVVALSILWLVVRLIILLIKTID